MPGNERQKYCLNPPVIDLCDQIIAEIGPNARSYIGFADQHKAFASCCRSKRNAFQPSSLDLNPRGGNFWAESSVCVFVTRTLPVPNLGDDADTPAAIFGQLAGAFYGAEAIPESWLERLAMRELITETADNLALAEIAPGA